MLFEAAIALAQTHSLKAPPLLLIDDFGDLYRDPVIARKLITILACASQGF